MANAIMRWFKWSHLPEGPAKDVSKECCDLAERLDQFIPDSAEKSAGLRHLMEAKDCFVRAALPEE